MAEGWNYCCLIWQMLSLGRQKLWSMTKGSSNKYSNHALCFSNLKARMVGQKSAKAFPFIAICSRWIKLNSDKVKNHSQSRPSRIGLDNTYLMISILNTL